MQTDKALGLKAVTTGRSVGRSSVLHRPQAGLAPNLAENMARVHRSGGKVGLVLCLFLVSAMISTPTRGATQATVAQQPPTVVSVPAARPADVASPDAIVAALYDVISGPRGQVRDWNRMRSLFIPGGMLMAVGNRPQGGSGIRVMTVNDYIALSGAQLENIGFREREIASRTERFGDIAHVFSTYEAFREDSTDPFMRGINSIQIMSDGSRWWLVSVFWQAEGPDNPIPAGYLSSND